MLTKTDFAGLEKRFATKEDLKKFEIRMEKKFATKDEFQQTIRALTDEIVELINSVREEFRKELVEIKQELKDIHLILDTHERRMDRFEDKLLN